MAWTAATRGDYVRLNGSYASDVTDREWALIAPSLPAARQGGRPRLTCLRQVVNAIFYLLQAGCQCSASTSVSAITVSRAHTSPATSNVTRYSCKVRGVLCLVGISPLGSLVPATEHFGLRDAAFRAPILSR